jgi:hypothetical protein
MDSISTPSSDENSDRTSTPSFKDIDSKREKQNKYMRFRLESDIFKSGDLIKDAIITSINLHRYIRKQSMDIKNRC